MPGTPTSRGYDTVDDATDAASLEETLNPILGQINDDVQAVVETRKAGEVLANGGIAGGTGFTVNKTGTGVYVVSLSTPLVGGAAITVTPNTGVVASAWGRITSKSVSLGNLVGFTVGMFSTGSPQDIGFEFIAQSY